MQSSESLLSFELQMSSQPFMMQRKKLGVELETKGNVCLSCLRGQNTLAGVGRGVGSAPGGDCVRLWEHWRGCTGLM